MQGSWFCFWQASWGYVKGKAVKLAQGTVGSDLESEFFDVEERPTSGLSTTPSPYGFPGRQSGTWVRVINPPPCSNLARSISSFFKVGANKLGCLPVDRPGTW